MDSLLTSFTQSNFSFETLWEKIMMSNFLYLLLFLIVFLIIGKLVNKVLDRIIDKLDSQKTPYMVAMFDAANKSVGFLFFYFGLRLGIGFMNFGSTVSGIVSISLDILLSTLIWFTIYNLVDVISVWLKRHSGKDSLMDEMLPPIVEKTARISIIVLFLLQLAQLLSDKPFTSVLAGLGVGGLAVALAAQETIRNFFGSLIIFSDKPFEVGERITVDTFDGVVEEVGFRSTRIRTLTGHLVTIPNGELANKSIENIGKRPHIRRLMNVGITYDTPPEKIEEAVNIIKELLENHEGMHPDFPPKVYFNDYGNFHLNILVLYWYHPGDYWKYMDFSQQFNFNLFKKFKEAGIDFAFPTQTLYIAGDKDRPLEVFNKNVS